MGNCWMHSGKCSRENSSIPCPRCCRLRSQDFRYVDPGSASRGLPCRSQRSPTEDGAAKRLRNVELGEMTPPLAKGQGGGVVCLALRPTAQKLLSLPDIIHRHSLQPANAPRCRRGPFSLRCENIVFRIFQIEESACEIVRDLGGKPSHPTVLAILKSDNAIERRTRQACALKK